MSDSYFFDTNIIVYAIIGEGEKRRVAKDLLANGGNISVQVLNELCNVLCRKAKMDWLEIESVVKGICKLVNVYPLTAEENHGAQWLSKNYGLSFYDSLILSSAVRNGGHLLYSEDMQHKQVVETITITNPFV